MTDKQIIIDGAYVDIIDKPKRYCEGIDCSWCDEKEPCIYKIANELEEQLKRKEKECEELKEQLAILDDETIVTEITLEQFEEYKKLKADNKALCERIVRLEEEVERQRTIGREYEQRWLTSMGYYGVELRWQE